MNDRFYATFDNDTREFTIFQRCAGGDRIVAGKITSGTWAECMVEWMNTLELMPEFVTDSLKVVG